MWLRPRTAGSTRGRDTWVVNLQTYVSTTQTRYRQGLTVCLCTVTDGSESGFVASSLPDAEYGLPTIDRLSLLLPCTAAFSGEVDSALSTSGATRMIMDDAAVLGERRYALTIARYASAKVRSELGEM